MDENSQAVEELEGFLSQLQQSYETRSEEADELEAAVGEAFWEPHLPKQERMFQKNVQYLSSYRFFLHDKEPIAPRKNRYRLLPRSEDISYRYDCGTKQYKQLETNSEHETRYFFQNLEQPLFVEHEFNVHHLRFLTDNVRASVDFAGDNHIYLWYRSMEVFSLLLYYADLESLCGEEKFVFLIGKEACALYPLDFQERFGIDYSSMTPKPIRIREMKRLCHWYKHAHSGTGFSLGILGSNSAVQMIYGSPFNTWSKLNDQPLAFTESFREFMQDVRTEHSFADIRKFAHAEGVYLHVPDLDDFLHWLDTEQKQEGYTIVDLLRGYALFHYAKRGLNPRVVPMLLFDPHMWDPRAYDALFLAFPYRISLTCMRDPIMRFASCYKNGIGGWNEFQTKYLLGSDYVHGSFLSQPFRENYWGFRFEDLKTKPRQALVPICRKINIPFEEKMLETDAPSDNSCSGEVIHGFDQKALHYKFDDVLSDFDKMRLKIFYEPIHKYYGYETFDSNEYPLPENLVKHLFSYPFRFERYLYPNVTSEMIHAWVQDVLQNCWRKKITCPKLIQPDEPEQTAQETTEEKTGEK